jgi:SAM-dependent methyltransferase
VANFRRRGDVVSSIPCFWRRKGLRQDDNQDILILSEYPDHFVRRLEILWGKGFMSPGGPEEVREVLRDIEVAGKTVLDIGCGIGGPDLVIARDLGAAKIAAVDIDENLVAQARRNAGEAGLADRIACEAITPGAPLPFAQGSFDIVFSKEAVLHVDDKPALFRDILRVLKPGGAFAASDWMGSEDCRSSPAWLEYQRRATYTISSATAAECAASLRDAGFRNVTTRDRNAWYATLAREQLALIEGGLRGELIAASNETIYTDWRDMRRAQTAAVVEGSMRPTHMRGYAP